MMKPLESLRHIFLLWKPHTDANLSQRLGVLDQLRTRHPTVSWKLLLNLVPTGHDVASGTSRPDWRPWGIDRSPITTQEFGQSLDEISTRLLSDVGTDADRWVELIGKVDDLPASQFDRALDLLEDLPEALPHEEARRLVWRALGDQLGHHTRFPEADWVMPQEKIDRLTRIRNRFEPPDPVYRNTWLFTAWPRLPQPSSRPGGEDVLEAQAQALEEIQESLGEEGFVALAHAVEAPRQIGFALASSPTLSSRTETMVKHFLESQDPALHEVSRGALWALGYRKPARLQGLLQADDFTAASSRAEAYMALPFRRETWSQLRDESPETREIYWTQVSPFGRGELDSDDVNEGTKSLLEHDRGPLAIQFLSAYAAQASGETVLLALETLAASPPSPDVLGNVVYEIGDLVSRAVSLPGVDEARAARLEWTFLPFLSEHTGHEPTLLHRSLAEDPGFFMTLLEWIYRSESEPEPAEADETSRSRAGEAFRLLTSWKGMPGLRDGDINYDTLNRWVQTAQELGRASGRKKVTDLHIGHMLANSPPGADGYWPHEAVRTLIEAQANRDIERGFLIQTFNNRGITTRGVGEGGQQERDLADDFERKSEATATAWPRTSRVLRDIARSYRADAVREDERAKVDRELWG